jgi:gluconate kinase
MYCLHISGQVISQIRTLYFRHNKNSNITLNLYDIRTTKLISIIHTNSVSTARPQYRDQLANDVEGQIAIYSGNQMELINTRCRQRQSYEC